MNLSSHTCLYRVILSPTNDHNFWTSDTTVVKGTSLSSRDISAILPKVILAIRKIANVLFILPQGSWTSLLNPIFYFALFSNCVFGIYSALKSYIPTRLQVVPRNVMSISYPRYPSLYFLLTTGNELNYVECGSLRSVFVP